MRFKLPRSVSQSIISQSVYCQCDTSVQLYQCMCHQSCLDFIVIYVGRVMLWVACALVQVWSSVLLWKRCLCAPRVFSWSLLCISHKRVRSPSPCEDVIYPSCPAHHIPQLWLSCPTHPEAVVILSTTFHSCGHPVHHIPQLWLSFSPHFAAVVVLPHPAAVFVLSTTSSNHILQLWLFFPLVPQLWLSCPPHPAAVVVLSSTSYSCGFPVLYILRLWLTCTPHPAAVVVLPSTSCRTKTHSNQKLGAEM